MSAPIVTRTDVVYGRVEGSALLANLAWPDGPGPRPAILSVHGGRWRAGNRTDASSIKVASWAEFGFFAMSIDYRLVGGSPAPAPYLDLRCAIRWLHAHADDYGVDPDRVYIIGQSAGGHMVSLAATLGDGRYPKVGGWESARSDVRAAIIDAIEREGAKADATAPLVWVRAEPEALFGGPRESQRMVIDFIAWPSGERRIMGHTDGHVRAVYAGV